MAKYTSVSISGYNATPPSDDGTVSESNKVKWSTEKTKLTDPLKTAIESINTNLVSAFDVSPAALTTNTTLGTSHYGDPVQVSGAGVTLTLTDAATLGAGWYCEVINTDSTNTVTIGRATGTDTINGTAANISLLPYQAINIFVNAAANGFIATAKRTHSKANTLAEDTTFTGSLTASGPTKFAKALGAHYLNNAAFSATAAANALTVTLLGEDAAAPSSTNPVEVAFRSTTATTGTSTVRAATAATTVVVPDGATLGFIANESSYIYVYLIDNAGTIELAVSGSPQHTAETVSTTAIGTGSDTKATLYSTSARTNVSCRYLGKIFITTGATPGQWPTPLALHSVTEEPPVWSIGYKQTWQTVTGSRALNTNYTNSTGKPIMISVRVTVTNSTSDSAGIVVDSVSLGTAVNGGAGGQNSLPLTAIVPPGSVYSVATTGSASMSLWAELR